MLTVFIVEKNMMMRECWLQNAVHSISEVQRKYQEQILTQVLTGLEARISRINTLKLANKELKEE
jgi:hypothetical protein